jgi:hypothetical protein
VGKENRSNASMPAGGLSQKKASGAREATTDKFGFTTTTTTTTTNSRERKQGTKGKTARFT